jgi:hypothetical protein
MIKYKKGYKYQLQEDYCINIPIYPEKNIIIPLIILTKEGQLTIKTSYAWDGPSGPALDTKTFMRPSLVHDSLYQFMRLKLLPYKLRKDIDKLLITHCKKDGMSWLRQQYVYLAVRFSGKDSATIHRQIYTAP